MNTAYDALSSHFAACLQRFGLRSSSRSGFSSIKGFFFHIPRRHIHHCVQNVQTNAKLSQPKYTFGKVKLCWQMISHHRSEWDKTPEEQVLKKFVHN